MKVALSEIKKKLQGTNSGGDEVKNQINDLEHKEEKNSQSEQPEEKTIQKNEDSVNSLWDNFKCTNIQMTGVPEGEDKEQEIENLFEKILKENSLNLVKETDIQVQEAQRIPNKMHAKRPTPIHITVKMPNVKDKERILKAVREKQLVTYKGTPLQVTVS